MSAALSVTEMQQINTITVVIDQFIQDGWKLAIYGPPDQTPGLLVLEKGDSAVSLGRAWRR
ncbi:MAG TPA: hypothetical protein VIY48_00135 [Candidatus Paceibacterota bacterium]